MGLAKPGIQYGALFLDFFTDRDGLPQTLQIYMTDELETSEEFEVDEWLDLRSEVDQFFGLKDEYDHALELYRAEESHEAGMTFEQCLEFVRAVDQEAERRREESAQ